MKTWFRDAAFVAFTLLAAAPAFGAEPSTDLRISGAVQRPAVVDLAALRALPASTLLVRDRVWTGVDLWRLLEGAAGLAGDAGAKNPSLPMYVVATGSDGYRVVFSLAELDPAFGNQQVLVAYAESGAALGQAGFVRLVVAGDSRGGRSVINLKTLEVFVAPGGR